MCFQSITTIICETEAQERQEQPESRRKTSHASNLRATEVKFFCFPEKKPIFFSLAEGFLTHNSAKPTQGVWGLPPRNSSNSVLLFPEKEAKSVVLLRRRFADPELGETDPGGLGACPQETNWTNSVLLFPEKEAKSVVLLRRRFVACFCGSPPLMRHIDPDTSPCLLFQQKAWCYDN
jgi:hypothetical protein